MAMRFGTWSARSPYRASSLTTVGTRLAKCTLGLVRIVDVGWDKSGIETAESLTPFNEMGVMN
jgi:hypothetical protein